MLKQYTPTWQVYSLLQVDSQQLKQAGIQAIFTDLDNTLVPWNQALPDEKVKQWVEQLREAGIQVVIISNNQGERVELVAQYLEVDYIARALKPLPCGILQALKKYQLQKEEVLMVGDQLLTDIKAAYYAGVRSALVPALIQSDSALTKCNRFFEKKIQKKLQNKNQWGWKEGLNG